MVAPFAFIAGIMAIIPDVPYVSVDIVVDGRALPEYLDEDDHESLSSNSTIKYVECVSGSKFGIRTNITGMEPWDLEGGNAVLEDYFLDGKWVDGAVKHFPLNRHHALSERDFMFADLVTTEDAISKTVKPDLKDLGTISVKLYYAELLEKRQKTKHYDQRVKVGHENLHEKHLKGQAMSYQAKLGEAVPIKDPASQQARQDEQAAIKKELKRERTEDDDSDDDLMIISSRRPAKSFKSSTNVDTGIETIDLTDD
ncbi:hypothetical protein D6C80_08841 [Aureobasidium pullulans]|nr:hypothetical protein D6C80_08841 [Aureobasidium pullulans]